MHDRRAGAVLTGGRGLLARADQATLVAAARDGDRAAFDELVRRTHHETYTLALRLVGDPDDARDVTQEAYLRAYRGLRDFRGDAQFSTWLYRITANRAATHLRRRIRHRHDPLTDDMWIGEAADEGSTRFELRHDLARAVNALPPKLRAVVVLRDVYGMAHAEIARELSISESAAKVRLHRARKKLRGELFGTDAGRKPGRTIGGETLHAV